jgi:hypothetical protein
VNELLSLLTFMAVAFLPGFLFLFIMEVRWILNFRFTEGGSFWLAVPTSFSLSIGLAAFVGWFGFFTGLGFQGVREIYFYFCLFLFLVGVYKFWQKRSYIPEIKLPRLRKPGPVEWMMGGLLLISLMISIYAGTWFSNTADSFNHIAAVRSLLLFDNPLPKQIYWPEPVSGMDPTFGAWHLVLAFWVSVANIDYSHMWLLATIYLAPLLLITFAVFALEFTRSRPAALISASLFMVIGLAGDFRIVAQPNRMGQILFWLALVYLLFSVYRLINKDQGSPPFEPSARVYIFMSGFLAWASGAVHIQYLPVLILLLMSSLVLFFAYHFLSRIIGRKDNETISFIYPWRSILPFYSVPLAAASLGLFIRSIYTVTDKYPLTSASTNELKTTLFESINKDLSLWFNNWDSAISIASILSLFLIVHWLKGNHRALIFVTASLMVPFYVIIVWLSVGMGGLIFSTFSRFLVLFPALLMVGWGWQLTFFIKNLVDFKRSCSINRNQDANQPVLIIPTRGLISTFFATIAILVSFFIIVKEVTSVNGGIVSRYASNSTLRTSVAVSQSNNLFHTRLDAIEEIKNLDSGIFLASSGVGYEMASLTGKLFIGLPSNHTPLQEKKFNNQALEDVIAFMNGRFNTREMVDMLFQHDVRYIYVDHTRYNDFILWKRLFSFPFLEIVAGNEEWKIYRFHSAIAVEYLVIDEKLNNAADFNEKLGLYLDMRELFNDDERYKAALTLVLPMDSELVLSYVENGALYESRPLPSMIYNFLDLINEAEVFSFETGYIERTSFLIRGTPRGVLFQHPSSRIDFQVKLPEYSKLDFSIALDPAVWDPAKGNGVEFIITITANGVQEDIFQEYIDPKNFTVHRRWNDYHIDLWEYSEKEVVISFQTFPGPFNDSQYDWAGWGEPRIRQRNPIKIELLSNGDGPIKAFNLPD